MFAGFEHPHFRAIQVVLCVSHQLSGLTFFDKTLTSCAGWVTTEHLRRT